MTHYSTAAETAALIQTATPEQTWLQAQLERIDPHCLEQGHDGAYTRALEALVLEQKAALDKSVPRPTNAAVWAKCAVLVAEYEGLNLTIERRPLQPLAMGHHEAVIDLYPVRPKSS